MPHSGGGGSHGGGFHAGGFGSSSAGRSAYAGRSSPSYFPGARRFVTYRAGKAIYSYADYSLIPEEVTAEKCKETITVSVIAFIVCVTVIICSFIPPRPITIDYDDKIVISDNIGVVENESYLREELNSFKKKTGVAPAVVTVSNETWLENYYDLSDYAYNLYLDTFEDEKHCLIVYSEPADKDPDFNEWYFETMIGDDTGRIFTEGKETYLAKELQKNFSDNSLDFDESIAEAFSDCADKIGKYPTYRGDFLSDCAFLSFILILIFGFVLLTTLLKRRKYKSYIENPNIFEIKNAEGKTQIKEDTCEYCGGLYVVGTVLSCPHCGAVIPPHNE